MIPSRSAHTFSLIVAVLMLAAGVCGAPQLTSTPSEGVAAPASTASAPVATATLEATATPAVLPAQATATPLIEAATETKSPVNEPASPDADVNITVYADGSPYPIDSRVLGTNLPAWLGASRFQNGTFKTQVEATGTGLVRIPGGSWSNYYDWLACENGGQGIDPAAECFWTWAARPTDFATFLRSTGMQGMYTINMNGTSKEAAAAVAFFNGSTSDNRVIGVDVKGRDWGKVSDWAQLRSDHGNPQPVTIRYWEIGNEIYGGKPGMGTDCSPYGWEDVWTCDGTEYVNGIGSGSNRHEGFIEFRDAMRFVDPTIQVGAVGVWPVDGWSNWGNEVISAAGSVMDFYIIHQYAHFNDVPSAAQALAEPETTWTDMMNNVKAAFAQYAGGRNVPVAVTEYNLYSAEWGDTNQWMSKALNGLYLADTLGQMLKNGFAMANHWDLAHGNLGGGYFAWGMMDADSYKRAPQYYAYTLWSRFGTEMLPFNSSANAASTLSVYAGRDGLNHLSILAINKTGNALSASINLQGVTSISGGTVDVMDAGTLNDLTVPFNGSTNPSSDLSSAPPSALNSPANPLNYTFPAYSVTLLRLNVTVEGGVVGTPAPTPTPIPTQGPPVVYTVHVYLPIVNDNKW